MLKTDGGRTKGKISFYCKTLEISRQAFYDYLDRKNKPWKYKSLADEIMKIHTEDEYNDRYGRKRMYMALMQKKDAGEIDIAIPCECTVRKVIEETNQYISRNASLEVMNYPLFNNKSLNDIVKDIDIIEW